MKAMKKLQIAVAVGTLLAAGAVSAATISQSGITLAREVVANNTQTVIAPTATFTYNGALSSNANSSQDFNIVLTLGALNAPSGKPLWDAALPVVGSVEFKQFVGGSYKSIPVIDQAFAQTAASAAIVLLGVEFTDATKTALRYKFRLNNLTATPVNLVQTQVNFNVTKAAIASAADANGILWSAANASVGLADMAKVTNLFTTAGTVDTGSTADSKDVCSDAARSVTLNAKNYTGSGVGAIGESTEAGVTNNGYIFLDQALSVHITKNNWAQNRTLDPAVSYQQFVFDTNANLGSTTVMNLGSVNVVTLNPAAWDLDVTGKYYDFREEAVLANWADLDVGGAPQSTQGKVDVSSLRVKVESSNGFAENGTIFLSNAPDCLVGGTNVVSTAGSVPASDIGTNTWNVSFSLAQLTSIARDASLAIAKDATASAAPVWAAPAAGTNKNFYLCYSVPGNKDVPQSTFAGTATIVKTFTTVENDKEQNNVSCKHDLNGLGGGVKIDVRNFLPYDPANGAYMGIVRVINNSEKTDADLWGQYIRADGKYGKWGSLGTLKARGARYFTSQEIDGLLTNNTTTADAPVDNTGAGGLTAATGEALPANTRLRISSTKASTLRVQNYVYQTSSGALTEVSGSQGADFVNIETYNNNNGVDSQDAQTGIKK